MPLNKAISRLWAGHLLFWILVALLWFYLRYQDYPNLQQAAVVTIIKVADLALIIYFANLVLVPKFLYRKKYVLFAVLFVAATALSSFFKIAPDVLGAQRPSFAGCCEHEG